MPLKNVHMYICMYNHFFCCRLAVQCGFLLCFYFHVRCLTRLLFMSLINLFMDFGSKRVKNVCENRNFSSLRTRDTQRRGPSNFMSAGVAGRLLSVYNTYGRAYGRLYIVWACRTSCLCWTAGTPSRDTLAVIRTGLN